MSRNDEQTIPMQRIFFYTQIKSNDFDMLKESCHPFGKDIFSADQEHIVTFEQSSHACKAALKFLNHISEHETKNDYKIVLVQGEFAHDRPEDLPVRVARSIHQRSKPKNLMFTEEVLGLIQASDIVFEKKKPVFIKALQKEVPMFALTRFEGTELLVDPTDLFDFSNVDSHSNLGNKPSDDSSAGPPSSPSLKNPFESSNSTIELDPFRRSNTNSKIVAPPAHPTKTTPSRAQADTRPKHVEKPPLKSIAIILVLTLLVTFAGFYLAKSKPMNPVPTASSSKPLPVPQIPEPLTVTAKTEIQTQEPATTPGEPVPHVGYLHIHSAPNGAEIWLNGNRLAQKTPINNLKVSTDNPIAIEAKKVGYKKVSKKIDLTPKETRTVLFQLTSASGSTPSSTTTKAKITSTKKKTQKKR